MRRVVVKVKGLTAYSSSRPLTEEKKKSESHDEFEKRIWPEKAHYNEEDEVYIPGVCFKLALDNTAKLIKEKIKGKGNQTYTGLFTSGVAPMGDMYLGIKKKQLKGISIFAHADGNRLSGSRVTRFFPYITEWGGEIEFYLFNDDIPEEVFERYFKQSGLLGGVGRGRPNTGCPAGNGRYQPLEFKWSEVEEI